MPGALRLSCQLRAHPHPNEFFDPVNDAAPTFLRGLLRFFALSAARPEVTGVKWRQILADARRCTDMPRLAQLTSASMPSLDRMNALEFHCIQGHEAFGECSRHSLTAIIPDVHYRSGKVGLLTNAMKFVATCAISAVAAGTFEHALNGRSRA